MTAIQIEILIIKKSKNIVTITSATIRIVLILSILLIWSRSWTFTLPRCKILATIFSISIFSSKLNSRIWRACKVSLYFLESSLIVYKIEAKMINKITMHLE